jgi:hypothetical protein
MRRHAPFALLLAALPALASCGPPPPYAALPQDAVVGAGDPTRTAILRSAYAFSSPGLLAGQPAAAARSVADMEYLATELRYGPRYAEFNPQVGLDFDAARQEWRQALDIAPGAPPQPVIDGLYAVARGDGPAALSPAVFPQPQLTMARLAALPPLPRTSLAATRAQQELNRTDQEGQTRRGGGNDAGGRGM